MAREATCHFLDVKAARKYYKDYGCKITEVVRKIRDKEIYIGMPPVKKGFRIMLDKNEGRYFYEKTL